ncbi:MAG: Gfo/Idh/MocA family protein [Chitinophagales bacterium]
MKRLIERYKNIRKKGMLEKKYVSKYAFVGIGQHSLYNLYPIIDFLGMDLKYILSKSNETAQLIAKRYPHIQSSTDIDQVLNDDEIKGVFICAHPSAHYQLVKKVLQSDKHVFVEKPPCTTLDQLEDLITVESQSGGTCLVGFQKRYAPSIVQLKKKIKAPLNYTYRYLTGAYPEGDSLLDLYIHPLNLIGHLFGDTTVTAINYSKTKGTETIFLHTKHGDTIGNIELSTDHSWQNAKEYMEVNTPQNIYTLKNMEELISTPKQSSIFSIPIEKIFPKNQADYTLNARNHFNPIFQNNQLYTMGYFDEIETFANLCEKGVNENITTLAGCKDTYRLIKKIKEH